MFSTWIRANAPTRRTALAVLAIPALLAPLACTAILGDFTVSSAGVTSDSGTVDSQAGDGPSDSTHFTDVVQIAAGHDHTCALRSTGEVYCWGDNSLGQLGTSAVSSTSATPVKVANLTKIRALAAGNNHTCALDGNITSGGKVYCWGSNSQGQLASASAGDHSAIAQTLANPTDLVAITAGADYTCGFDSSGIVFCWGSNSLAQLGTPSDSTKHTDTVTPLLPNGVQEISAGSEITCAVASGAPPTIECWGTSNHAEIPVTPDGGTEAPPTTINFGGVGAAHVASGLTHVCGTDTSGAAYCWGSNDYGESANAGNTGAGVTVAPNLVPGVSGVAAIGAGENYSCALTVAKYGVSCWGSNNYGALGNGQPTSGNLPQAAPSDVATLSGVGIISIGFRHACAVVKPAPSPGQADTASGAAWCWGDNSKGQLGDGTTGNQKSTPVQVLKPAS